MELFGYSYPPGCSGTPFDEPDPPCEICGNDPDHCICPECAVCGAYGDPFCYLNHGLRRTEDQKFSFDVNERLWRSDFEALKLAEELLDQADPEWP